MNAAARWLVLAAFATPGLGGSDDFAVVERLTRQFYAQQHPAQAGSITEIDCPSTEGGLPNSRGIEMMADATVRLKNGDISRVQLYKKQGMWTVARELGGDVLAEAHPQMVDELLDPDWRETRRLEARLAAELESRLRREKKLRYVQKSYPRCFVNLKFDKALCDIQYATWTSDEPECFNRSELFNRVDGNWIQSPGAYHPGMRIDPDTGAIFEMSPPEPCHPGGAGHQKS